jgi:drug/metabolite transporter (DMT)-like permease
MNLFAVSFALAVGGNVLYHVSQKSVPAGAPPLLSLLVTYAVALAGTALLLPFAPSGGSFAEGLRKLNWASAGVGVAIIAVELGVLLAYRAGWKISVGSVAISAAVALALIPTGLFLFREKLTMVNVAGLGLCLVGLVLIARR